MICTKLLFLTNGSYVVNVFLAKSVASPDSPLSFTQLTGKRTSAAVAGLCRDHRIQNLLESGEVFWYQLEPEVLEAE